MHFNPPPPPPGNLGGNLLGGQWPLSPVSPVQTHGTLPRLAAAERPLPGWRTLVRARPLPASGAALAA